MPLFLGPKEDLLLAGPDDKDLAVSQIGHIKQRSYVSRIIALPMQQGCDGRGGSEPFTWRGRGPDCFFVGSLQIADGI